MATGPAVRATLAKAWALWKPPPRIKPSEWMEREVTVPSEETAVPGRYRFTRYEFLRQIVDSFVDPTIEVVAVQKPAQVGWTLAFTAVAAYFVRCDPSRILVAMPTESECEIWSKDRFEPVVRATATVASLIRPAKLRDANNKIMHKRFPGGAIKMVGATSPTGLASYPAKRIMLDEVDRYPASAGTEGDPISLVKKRAQTYLRRGGKLVAGSTPGLAGMSLIESLVEQGDKREWRVPCHHAGCGHEQRLQFEQIKWGRDTQGRHETWTATYRCEACGRPWTDIERIANVARGRWVPTAPTTNVRSYLIDGLMSPDVTHAEFGREWLAADNDEKRKAFVNTYLGRTWTEENDAPDWKDLARRKEAWPKGSLPDGVLMLTAAVDVQKRWLTYTVWGWGRGGEAWPIETETIDGGPEEPASWARVDALLERSWTAPSGEAMQLDRLAVDSGAFTEEVYGWGRDHRFDDRVVLVKGDARQALVVGPRHVQDWTPAGKKAKFGVSVTIVGTNKAKDYLLRKLRLAQPVSGEETPAGYIHLPEWMPDEELQELVAERKVRQTNRRGYTEQVWKKKPGDRNEALDKFVYSYAVACSAGLWSAPGVFWDRREEAYGPRPPEVATEARPPVVTQAKRISNLFAPRVMRSDDPFVE
jgi:phage terminase large subunit GpA-like protein